ncbi:MAG: magnesium transporter [Bacillota bacterium]|nr:magnesium transporter [Bacillota bacterium]
MREAEFIARYAALVEEGRIRELREQLSPLHPADIAEIIEELEPEKGAMLFRMLPKDEAAEVMSALDPLQQQQLVEVFAEKELVDLIANMFVDDAVDLVEELPSNAVRRILQLSSPEKRATLNRFMQYPEQSAGSVMTEEFIRLREFTLVGEAIAAIRADRRKRVSLHTAYITTADNRLTGVVSISELLVSPDDVAVGTLGLKDVISVTTDTDQEEVVAMIRHYGFLSMPVVDSDGRLVGVVTVDDALYIAEEEATEDFELMAATTPAEDSYLNTSILSHAKNRLPWLLILMISGLLNGLILGSFEHAFIAVPLLVTFIPMLTDTGGNTGSQSSTLVIRGLAVGEIQIADALRVLRKELGIAFIIGSVLGLVGFARVMLLGDGDINIALTVSLALVAVVMLAKLIGGLLPIAARRIGLDPALMAAPMITTIVDAIGLIIFFSLAKLLLPI